jgi:transcriptional regulator with XRE-family HTH domain
MLDGGGHEIAWAASRQAPLSSTEPLHVLLARRLRWLRVERGWSRDQVARRLRVPVAHVEGHEHGTRRMEARDLAAYARLFGVRISDFFKDPPTKGSG